MKFISLDIETTGIDPKSDQILEFGAVLVNTNTHPSTWATFHTVIKHTRYSGNAYAIQLNNRLFRILAGIDKSEYTIVDEETFLDDFYEFLLDNGYEKNDDDSITFTVAGKNVAGFDLPFLNMVHGWKKFFRPLHRVIDPGSMYIDFLSDQKPPDLKQCKERAGINTPVSHNALEDALDVVYTICHKIGFNFNDRITDEYLKNHYELIEDDEDIIRVWEINDFYKISSISKETNIFKKYAIHEVGPIDKCIFKVWNINELVNL